MNSIEIGATLKHFLSHTNYVSEYKIEVEYDPEHDEFPMGTITVDGAIVSDKVEFPSPYVKEEIKERIEVNPNEIVFDTFDVCEAKYKFTLMDLLRGKSPKGLKEIIKQEEGFKIWITK